MNKNDRLPSNFKYKNHAPLIQLGKLSPLYSTRARVRASALLARTWPQAPFYTGPTWALIYYIDLPRMKLAEAYNAISRLRSTPGDLLARYVLSWGIGGGFALARSYLGNDNWILAHQALVLKLAGMAPATDKKKKPQSRSGGEKIEHIAFHPTMLLLAMSTTYARVHLFDLRSNSFFDYFLCAADDPADLVVTSLAFNSANQLAVGMDTGYVDVWTVDLSASKLREWELSETPRKPQFASRFFDSTPSPQTREILMKDRPRQRKAKAAVVRVTLAAGGILGQRKLVGSVTAVSFSPSGTHLAIGTSASGVWIYNLTMDTAYHAHPGSFTAASAKCTSVLWAVPPGVKYLPLRGAGSELRYQRETGATALVAGMADGAVVYLAVRENGLSSIALGSPPVEFYPSKLAPGAPGDTAIGQVLLVPSPPPTSSEQQQQYTLFPTLVVSFVDAPGIHIFRLVPESVLKASVPPAASATVVPEPGFRAKSMAVATGLLHEWCAGGDVVRAVHVGTLDTSSVVSLPKTAMPLQTAVEGPRHIWEGYGGVVRSMAIDPTARRLVVAFSSSGDTRVEDSVVWFDAGAIRALNPVLGALEVLRPQRVISGDGSDGGDGGGGGGGVVEVHFAGGFEGGACAGMITDGGKGVGIFPAWISAKREGGE